MLMLRGLRIIKNCFQGSSSTVAPQVAGLQFGTAALRSLMRVQAGWLLLGLISAVLIPLSVKGQNQPATPAASPTAVTSPRPTLQVGSQGAAVSELQALLKLLGFYTGSVDGVYRETTAAAVSAFQQAAGLQPDGIAGAETWTRLLPSAPPVAAATPAPRPAPAPSPAPSPVASPAPVASPTPSPAPSPAPTPTATTPGFTPATPSSERPILRLGAQGEAVTQLQERLRTIGVFTGTVDGVFGPETEAAVRQAQQNYNLEPDGVVGPATWEALLQGN